MASKGLTVLTKYSVLFSPLLFGACSTSSLTPSTLSLPRSEICQEALKKSISSLIHAQHLQISSDIFTKDAYLYLNNKKDSPLHSSPIFNDLLGKKTLLLYKENKKLYIGLVGRDEKIKNSVQLIGCEKK